MEKRILVALLSLLLFGQVEAQVKSKVVDDDPHRSDQFFLHLGFMGVDIGGVRTFDFIYGAGGTFVLGKIASIDASMDLPYQTKLFSRAKTPSTYAASLGIPEGIRWEAGVRFHLIDDVHFAETSFYLGKFGDATKMTTQTINVRTFYMLGGGVYAYDGYIDEAFYDIHAVSDHYNANFTNPNIYSHYHHGGFYVGLSRQRIMNVKIKSYLGEKSFRNNFRIFADVMIPQFEHLGATMDSSKVIEIKVNDDWFNRTKLGWRIGAESWYMRMKHMGVHLRLEGGSRPGLQPVSRRLFYTNLYILARASVAFGARPFKSKKPSSIIIGDEVGDEE